MREKRSPWSGSEVESLKETFCALTVGQFWVSTWIPSLVSMDYVIEASHDCPTINVGTEIVTVDGDHDDAAKVIGALSIDQ